MAMYRSKASRRGTVSFFDDQGCRGHSPRPQAAYGRRHRRRAVLPALPADRRRRHPPDRRRRGPRPLVRHDGNPISPTVFIPIAEESASIALLGSRLLQDACLQLKRWRDLGLTTVPVSLNISPLQCRDPSFGARLVATIQDAGIPTSLINIEITESTSSATRGHPEEPRAGEVVRHGVHIDDFGTGYSSPSPSATRPSTSSRSTRASSTTSGGGAVPRRSSRRWSSCRGSSASARSPREWSGTTRSASHRDRRRLPAGYRFAAVEARRFAEALGLHWASDRVA